MTDRHAGFVVVLEEDLRADLAIDTLNAIRQIKGVIDVTPIVSSGDLHIAQARAQREIEGKILRVLYPRMES